MDRTSAITNEYLRDRFQAGLVEGDEGLFYRHVDRFAARFPIVF